MHFHGLLKGQVFTVKPLSHGPLIRRSGSNPDHTDRLIRINMWVETTFRGGFDPHLIRIKDGGG